MKRADLTLTEIALDEIYFDTGYGSELNKTHTRQEFNKICEALSTLPMLRVAILFFKGGQGQIRRRGHRW